MTDETPVADTGAINHDRESTANGHGAAAPHEEHQYLNLIRGILAKGEHRPD
ncbi:MAG: hypothetical protein LQ346_007654, partial [Caloplaca aetnensis]